jgi:hypothetical protein
LLAFHIGPVNGRDARESRLWLKAWVAPTAAPCAGQAKDTALIVAAYESIRNVISAIERERTTPALAALAQQLREAEGSPTIAKTKPQVPEVSATAMAG